MGKLTTHVLDTSAGRPAANLLIELYRGGSPRTRLVAIHSNADGRCDQPLLQGAALTPGEYELVFHTADYFRAQGADLPQPPFLGTVIVRFGIADAQQHYHVPLLVSPWGYTTYRGS
jgi:5-hydroxyisourate hydrolase